MPPSSDEGNERAADAAPRGSEVHGLEAVRTALADLEFPQDKRGLLDAAGSWRVPVLGEEGRRDERLATFLDELPEGTYRSADEVVEALRAPRD